MKEPTITSNKYKFKRFEEGEVAMCPINNETCSGPFDIRDNLKGCRFWYGCPHLVKEMWEVVSKAGVEIKRKLIKKNVDGKLVDVESEWIKPDKQGKLF